MVTGFAGYLYDANAINKKYESGDWSRDWYKQEQDQAFVSAIWGTVAPPIGIAYSLGCSYDDDADPNPHNGWRLENGRVVSPQGRDYSVQEYREYYDWSRGGINYEGMPDPDHLLRGQH